MTEHQKQWDAHVIRSLRVFAILFVYSTAAEGYTEFLGLGRSSVFQVPVREDCETWKHAFS